MKRSVHEMRIAQIANAIIELTSQGSVTLAQIHERIPGFAEANPRKPSWCWEIGNEVVWDGMTRDGCSALRRVVLQGDVSLQPSNVLIYFLHGRVLNDANWQPFALTSKSAANFNASGILISVPPANINDFLKAAIAIDGSWVREIFSCRGK